LDRWPTFADQIGVDRFVSMTSAFMALLRTGVCCEAEVLPDNGHPSNCIHYARGGWRLLR
jgi:hypothetical protein